MTYNKSCDPMDRLIKAHIGEARDLRMHMRPVYGSEHVFSAGFENKMGRLLHSSGITFSNRRLLIAAIAILTLMMSIFAIQALKKEKVETFYKTSTNELTIYQEYSSPDSSTFRTPSFGYIPSGFTQIEDHIRDDEQMLQFYNTETEKTITLFSRRMDHTYAQIKHPFDDPIIEETTINNHQAIIFNDEMTSTTLIYWSIDNYALELSSDAPKEEVVKFAKNISLK